MIFGVHNILDAFSHYTHDHLSTDGALWILALDGILLIPLIFAVFFYPMAVLIAVGAVAVLTVAVLALRRIVHARLHPHP